MNLGHKEHFDEAWKDVIEFYFEDFLKLLFPEIYNDIDWKRGYEFLDKELEKVLKESLTGKRRVDKLVKVYLKTGEEKYILIHIEIQGQAEQGFERRVYVYNYRITDRYGVDVVSLAVLADEKENFRPNEYKVKYWGFEYSFKFPVVKLIDYRGKEDELERSGNIFGDIIVAHLKSLETRGKLDERLLIKKSLIKRLYDKGYSRKDILNLYRFMDWVLGLPKEIEEKLYDEIKEYEAKEVKKMPLISTAERIGMEKGLQAGIQEGIQKGIQKGREEGIQEGKMETVKRMLEYGADMEFIKAVTGLSEKEIEELKGTKH